MATAMLSAVGYALYELFAEPQGIVTAQQRQVMSGKDSGLEITGWLAQDRATKGLVLPVWYRLINVGAAPVVDLHLALHAPGFSPPNQGAKRSASFPIYSENPRDVAVQGSGLWDLQPGATRTIRAEMVATGRSGDYMVTACFNWHRASGAEAATLDLGPLRVHSASLEQIKAWKDFATAAAPLIAPLVVLLIGLRFQTRQQYFVQERQAWAAMLPFSHQNNTRSYLPLLSAISTFEDELAKLQSHQTTANQRSALFYFLMSVRIMREVDANGGFYLMDRQGEDLVVACWNAFRDDFLEHLAPFEDFSSVVDAVDPQDSLSSFAGKLSYTLLDQRVRDQGRKLEAWATGDQSYRFKVLSLFRVLLLFEINRIYDFWYGGPGDFPVHEYISLLSELQR